MVCHWENDHTPGQAQCPLAAGQHKMNPMMVLWTLGCILVCSGTFLLGLSVLIFTFVMFGVVTISWFFIYLFILREHKVEWVVRRSWDGEGK